VRDTFPHGQGGGRQNAGDAATRAWPPTPWRPQAWTWCSRARNSPAATPSRCCTPGA
jgi:hypothetical protein